MTKKYIEENLLTKNKSLNSNKTKLIMETTEELYLIYHDLQKPICPVCNKNNLKFKSFTKGYSDTCSRDCSNIDPKRIDSIQKNTNKENKNNSIRKNWEEKRKKKYGDNKYCSCGVELVLRGGGLGYTKTCKKKDCMTTQTKNTRTANKKTGVIYQNYDVKYDNLTKEYIETHFITDSILNKVSFMKYYNCKDNFMYVALRKLNIKYSKTKKGAQQLVAEHIDYYIEDTRKIIAPYELDIYSEQHKFAVEYNGLIFHSSGAYKKGIIRGVEKDYHLMKTELCEEKGIQLFHIFENEWLDENKKSIWISMLNGKMNKHMRLGARKTNICLVSSLDAKTFLEENHLQGSVNSSVRVGLYYKKELVSLMTFGKARMSKKYDKELYRFCTKKNLVVQGAGSKLLKYFEENFKPKSLASYANRRWSEGNLYDKLGFEHSHNSPPNMFWFAKGSMLLESRQNFQKHKLKDIPDFLFDPDITAKENMFLNNYRVIYDSGNKVYIKEYHYDED